MTPADEESSKSSQLRGANGPGRGKPDGADQLRRQIEETRAELGETVEAISAKTDVREQARQKVTEVKQGATATVAELQERVRGATPEQARQALAEVQQRATERPEAVAFLAGLVVGWLLGRRKK